MKPNLLQRIFCKKLVKDYERLQQEKSPEYYINKNKQQQQAHEQAMKKIDADQQMKSRVINDMWEFIVRKELGDDFNEWISKRNEL